MARKAAFLHTLLLAGLSLAAPSLFAEEYAELDWLELMPADERAFFDQPVDHSSPLGFDDMPPPQSFNTVPEMDGRKIKLPGFIVPLDGGDGADRVSEFFLVPYFGACIHLPPPPPNQIVYTKNDESFEIDGIWQPYWIYGTLRIQRVENEVAASAYVMDVEKLEVY